MLRDELKETCSLTREIDLIINDTVSWLHNVEVYITIFLFCLVAADVQCFGRDCYPVVFAVNTVLIVVATRKY